MWHMRDGNNVMECIKPGEQMRMMHLSVNDTGILGKEIRVLLLGVETKTFRLLTSSEALPLCHRRLVGANFPK